MKYTLSILLILSVAVSINASDEYPYIKPIAIEEASVSKVAAPKEEIAIEKTKEQKQDSDNDGIFDEDDQCPNTVYGIEVDENGCKLDSDNDGIVDSKDQCPGTSSEFLVDGHGCPQTATLKLNFAHNSYKVSDELIYNLKEFAKFLEDNADYQVIIYGHTDSIGTDINNKELSKKRADSVKEVLIRYGIKEIRLTAIGKGESEPVADNDTEEGRAANRRIEVELLQ